MSSKCILITGGAGFIGSHLSDALLLRGHHVRVLDVLAPQVHEGLQGPPGYLPSEVEFIYGDIRDAGTLRRALSGVDAVYHFAAAVGVGQSMYELEKYTGVNTLGTAVLLEALMAQPVETLIVASSMSVYGEGLYRTHDGQVSHQAARSLEQLQKGIWDIYDHEGKRLEPMATPESKMPLLNSVYALSKYDQERLCLMVGHAYRIATVALRFFNVFGPRQALSNPYTGVLAIFAARYMNEQPPLIFEDGCQRRDFVSVYDVVQACCLALDVPEAAGHVMNIGSGHASTIRDVAAQLGRALGKDHLAPCVTQTYRMGDIRHCFADITLARSVLGYEPRVPLAEGLHEWVNWVSGQQPRDRVERATLELTQRGLTV
jgi:dTDP-L-rhamnose 4-epimerase